MVCPTSAAARLDGECSDCDCDYNFEFRSVDDKGRFTGYASIYGVEDSYGSIFDPGSIEPDHMPLPLTYQHDWNQVLGAIDRFENRGDGAYVEGYFDLNIARAREIYGLAKAGVIRGLSHRFIANKNEFRGGKRHVVHATTNEITLTPIPSNKSAGIISIRSEEPVAGVEHMEEEQYDDYNYTDDSRYVSVDDDESETRALDTTSGWDAGAARRAWKKAATGSDGKVNTGIYGRGFLVKGGDKLSDYKFPIGMPTDGGQLKVVCRAVQAAEGRLEHSNVGNKGALASKLEGLAKKCGFRDKKDGDGDGDKRSAQPQAQPILMSEADGAHHHSHSHVGMPADADVHNQDGHHHHPHMHVEHPGQRSDGEPDADDVQVHNADRHHHHSHVHDDDGMNNHMDGTTHGPTAGNEMGSGPYMRTEKEMTETETTVSDPIRSEDEEDYETAIGDEKADEMLREMDEKIAEFRVLVPKEQESD